jgi:glucose-fructose oxidoreductase
MTSSERIRYAVAGLGWFAQTAVLPAFAHAERNSELVALFSGDPKKRHELGQRYGIDQTHGYDRFEQVLADGGIDAVYITLPNHLHREFTEKAAAAGQDRGFGRHDNHGAAARDGSGSPQRDFGDGRERQEWR